MSRIATLDGSAAEGLYWRAVEMLKRYDRVPPLPDSFVYCYDYGCSSAVQDVGLGESWAAIEASFKPAAQSPAEERQRVAEAVARFEQSMGSRYGTAVVVERDTAKAYAIDSWFQDNGQKADVVPVQAWFDGWVPG